MKFLGRWRDAAYAQHQLDALLATLGDAASDDRRKAWLIELLAWIRGGAGLLQFDEDERAAKRAVRVRFLLGALERTPAHAAALRALVRDTLAACDPVDLLAEGGLAQSDSLWQELKERTLRRWLPHGTAGRSLLTLFGQLFPDPDDAHWVGALDAPTLEGLARVLDGGELDTWFAGACEDSLRFLVAQVRAAGMATPMRLRIGRAFRDLPFLALEKSLEFVFAAHAQAEPTELGQRLNLFRGRLADSRAALAEAYAHLDAYGVNTHVVFQLVCLRQQLDRIERLIELYVAGRGARPLSAFVAELVHGVDETRSVAGFLRQTTALLAKKLVERSADTGEHYITRNRAEYLSMLRSAAGGGLLTSLTTTLKFAIASLHLPRLAEGTLFGLNYAGSFVAIQFCGATLATKQPAATATALAAQMHDLSHADRAGQLVEEVVCLVRSQFAAIAGNLAAVIPGVVLIGLAWAWATGGAQLDPDKARATVDSLAALGPSWPFAAFTGVLLWLSSLVAGWADNWFAVRQIGENMTTNRRLLIVFGARRVEKMAEFLRHHIAGVAGNVSLGFMLALIPAVAGAFGLPIDVRHVTLSTGSLAAAVMALGPETMLTGAFWHAVLGIAGIGALNLGVSFYLALQVALRARGVPRVEKKQLYQQLRAVVWREPRRLFWPPGPARPAMAPESRP